MTYGMTKPMLNADIFIYVIGIIVILLGVFILVMMLSSRNYTICVKEERLYISSLFYNTNIELKEIDVDNMKVINLNTSGITINSRVNGLGLPGLLVGWFSSSAGKLKLYVSDKTQVLSIPTKLDYQIFFSTVQGEEIIKDGRFVLSGTEKLNEVFTRK